MGEMAEMMLNGFFCECCGVYLDGDEPGYPRYCSRRCLEGRTPGLTEKQRNSYAETALVKRKEK